MSDTPTPGQAGDEPAPAEDTDLRERAADVWSAIDWTLWGHGLGDELRERMADTMLAAVSTQDLNDAVRVFAAWKERRGFPTYHEDYQQHRDGEKAELRVQVASLRAENERLRRDIVLAGESVDPLKHAHDQLRTAQALLRQRNRSYGRASATIGELRGQLARNRARNAAYLENENKRLRRDRNTARADLDIRCDALADALGMDRTTGYYDLVHTVAELRARMDRLNREAHENGVRATENFDALEQARAELADLRARAVILPEDWESTIWGLLGEYPRVLNTMRKLFSEWRPATPDSEQAATPTAPSGPEPRVFPPDSPEPGPEVRAVRSTANDIVFKRNYSTWEATEESNGDGRTYSWWSMNSSNSPEGGMTLVEVFSGPEPRVWREGAPEPAPIRTCDGGGSGD